MGVNVRVATEDALKALVASSDSVGGTSFIDVFIPNGQAYKDFYVQGLAGASGSVVILATCPLTTDGSLALGIVTPALDIAGLTERNYGAEDLFQVRTGIPNDANTGMAAYQAVSAGAAVPLPVDLGLSNGAAGQLVTFAGSGASARVYIAQGSYQSPSAKVDGGVAFQGLRTGSTIVTASSPDFLSTLPSASVDVVVGIIYIPAGQQNLSRLPGAAASASSVYPGYSAANGIDGNQTTAWFTANNDPTPWFEVELPADATVHSLQIQESSSYPNGYDFLAGSFQVMDGSGVALYSSGGVSLTRGNLELVLPSPVSGARRVRFQATSWESIEPGFGEFAVVGTQP